MFPIIVNDGQTPFPSDDIYYIVCKEGIYLKKRLGVMESIAPVKEISILQSIDAMAKMHIRKIPAKQSKQVVNFFKAVYAEHYAEAIVLLFYNQKTKHHKIICPFQEVSGGSADYNKAISIEGYDMIGTIHSHAAMSAFHSGIDDADEKSFDGLHITFGNMRDDDISISASIVANGYRVIVDPRDYINQLEMTVDINEDEKIPFSKTWKWDKTQKKMIEVQSGKFYTKRKFDQRYQVKLSKDPKFDEQWMERVEKKVWTARSPAAGGDWTDGWYGYGAHYGESAYWQNWRGHQQTKLPMTVTPPVTPAKKPAATKNNLMTTGVAKAGQTPCDICTFKNSKINFILDELEDEVKESIIEWALDQLDQNAKYKLTESIGDDADDLTHYHCVACDERFSVDESAETGVCPTCKVDDYLLEISASEVMMGDEEEEPISNKLDMTFCDACGSSYTADFIKTAGECPICKADIDVPETEEGGVPESLISCPSCEKQFAKVKLMFDNKCQFCGFEFDPFVITRDVSTEDINIETAKIDSGDYLDPDAEAIQKAIEADQQLERIPVPGATSTPLTSKQPRKPGVFASIFQRRNKKS